MVRQIGQVFQNIKNFFSSRKQRVLSSIDKNPYRSFYIALGILLALIVISNVLGSTKPADVMPAIIQKEVDLYTVGTAPRITVLAKVEKSGVVTISALTPGVVSHINKPVGSTVRKGEVLVSMASNYQGGNSSSLQRQLAQVQYDNTLRTYDLQKEIIGKQRELAAKGDIQADEMRDITSKSLDETRSLIGLNDQIISSLDASIANLESTNVAGANDALILSTKQLKVQFVAGTNAARQGLRMAEYNAAGDKAPAQMSDISKDMAIKQLEIQEKMLDMNREISGIQLKIARVVEAMMYPGAPFAGTIERVFVKKGQSVSPGTPLAVISGSGTAQSIMAVAFVSAEMAWTISRLEESDVHIGTESIALEPVYITNDPVQGSLHGVYFEIPSVYRDVVAEGGYVEIDIPVGYYDTAGSAPFVPVDSVYQTKDKNYIFVAEGITAQSREVELGQVLGSLVEVTKGLDKNAKVILNRNIISGDTIKEAGK